jgi:hypothetical protein
MVLRGCTSKLLRWPILLVVFLVLAVEFLLYLLVRLLVNLFELTSGVRHRVAKKTLRNATDFVTWCQAARELDRLEGREAWKLEEENPYYDHALVRSHMNNLQTMRSNNDFDGMMALLKLILQTYNVSSTLPGDSLSSADEIRRNFGFESLAHPLPCVSLTCRGQVGGINNGHLYTQTHFGTKELVVDFLQTVLECLIVLRDAEEVPLATRRDFFRRARKWYGRTALLLSGGAAMGYYHTGVLKTLLEAKCLPQILSGASAGSLMCSFVAVRTDQEVMRDLCVPEAEKYFRACEEVSLGLRTDSLSFRARVVADSHPH